MSNKIGRNEKCPCGSGKKYKHCCIDQATTSPFVQNQAKLLDIIELVRQHTRKPDLKICMHPQKDTCDERIIKAHSIHKAGILSRISKNGKVMMIDFNIEKGEAEKFDVNLGEEGNNKATTFRNFCAKHDKTLFQEIEDKEYQQSLKQNFLFAFRAFALEHYKKQVSFNAYLELSKDDAYRFAEEFLQTAMLGMTMALSDFGYEKELFENGIINEDYNWLDTSVLTLDHEAKLAVSTVLELNYDLKGNRLNNLEDPKRVKRIFFSIFPQAGKTHILFSWLKEDASFFENFKAQLLSLTQHQIKNFINNAVPCYTEHFVLHPDLWNSHSPVQKRKLIEKFLKTMIPTKIRADLLSETDYDLCKTDF
jgi:hypothetical protein